MQLTKDSLKRKNFLPNEFFNSEKADELGVVNYPTKNEEYNILTCLNSTADLMQEVRDILGKPIKINSAYRCKKVNDAVGSKDTSQHLQGLACDFTSLFGSPMEVVKFLHKKQVLVDQCFCEGSWVHISRCLQKSHNRMMYGTYLSDKTGNRVFKPL